MQFLSLLTTRRLVRFKELNIWLHIELRSDLLRTVISCWLTNLSRVDLQLITLKRFFLFFDNLAQEKQI